MENSPEKSAKQREIARVPAFTITPAPRCYSKDGSSRTGKCGALATRRRDGNRWFRDSFHCDKHAHETDSLINGDLVIRRVRVTCDILFAGVDEIAEVAQLEAVGRLAAAIEALGGVLDEKMTTSQIGRYAGYSGPRALPLTMGG